jgi:hypothetical protein
MVEGGTVANGDGDEGSNEGIREAMMVRGRQSFVSCESRRFYFMMEVRVNSKMIKMMLLLILLHDILFRGPSK